MQKRITLSIDSEAYIKFQKFCEENDIIISKRVERFNENTISGLVYNIRMKKYAEKLQVIKEELPVFEDRLKFKKRKA